MKKIIFVDEENVVNYSGGAEKIMCQMANALALRGYGVGIVCMNRTKGVPFFPLEDAVKFINLCYDFGEPPGILMWMWKKLQREVLRGLGGREMKIGGRKYQDPKKAYWSGIFIRRLAMCLQAEAPDIIVAVSAYGAHLTQKTLREISVDTPIITMCHGDPRYVCRGLAEEEWEAWRKSRYVQVLLPSFTAALERHNINHTVVIPNPIEQYPESAMADLTHTHYKIVTAGRLEGIGKRQHLLIEAFISVAEKFPRWTLWIYGEADNVRYTRKLRRMIAKHGLEERIFLPGRVTDLPQVMRETDIFAFPSVQEGFGLAVCEAMSLGLPVAAYRECYPTGEIIINEENGLLAESGVTGLADCLTRLMSDKNLRQKLGKAAHLSMAAFAPNLIWDKWEKLLENV